VHEVIDALKNGTLNEAFGTGTAVTVAHVAVIGYEGVNYDIPVPNEKSFSVKVLETLENIKRGNAEDPYGWIYKVK
jgi:branched-chain amino acid aminotransferase